MQNLRFVFLILALVLFLLAALWVPPNPPRVNLIAAGLFFATLAWLVTAQMKYCEHDLRPLKQPKGDSVCRKCGKRFRKV